MHTYYAEAAMKHAKDKDADHFGNSIAIIVGDILGAFGNQVLFEAKFDPKIVVRALRKMQDIVSCTAIGEAQDVYIENKDKRRRKKCSDNENKTAKYTIEACPSLSYPAGANEKFLQVLRSIQSQPASLQIQDDILGVLVKSKDRQTVGQIGRQTDYSEQRLQECQLCK
jgi:geranylgeranyl diphosphate synthase type I